MPKNVSTNIRDLTLDLRNYRTIAQSNEMQAVQSMISISPDRFWALVESLLDDGYLPTENVIVLKEAGIDARQTVREGNRRVAALKLIHGLLPKRGLEVPSEIEEKIKTVSDDWKNHNQFVPCVVYGPKEAAIVDHIVTLTHGKGEQASREEWKAIARARHNRDAGHVSEPGLDILEKYFKVGRNVSKEQADNWAGTYPISVLDEAIKKLAPRLGLANAPELAKRYPKLDHRDALDAIIKDIGVRTIKFDTLRHANRDFAAAYGIAPGPDDQRAGGHHGTGRAGDRAEASSSPGDTSDNHGAGAAAERSGKKTAAVATNDPKSVMRTLRKFTPLGEHREKVVALKKEMLTLKLNKAPTAFCLLLRSAFEISAKAYCEDHKKKGGPTSKDARGNDKKLVEVLRGAVTHLTNNKSDREMTKSLHGAITELGKSEGLLSVASMNQLVHNPKFSVLPSDVAGLFWNVYPLLEAMNS